MALAAGRSGCAFTQARHCCVQPRSHNNALTTRTLTQRLDNTVCNSRRRCAAPQSCALLRTRLRATLVFCAAADAGSGSRSVDLQALRRKRAERPAQPPPARNASRQPQPTREQLQLNRDIPACTSADAVLDLVASQWAVLNEVNAATALTIIQRRAGKRSAWLQSDPRFAQLLSAAESLFERMGPRELTNAFYACGQLDVMPPSDWLDRFWHVSAAKLLDFDPQACSNTDVVRVWTAGHHASG
jgi:hypothetical protein